MNGAIEGWRRTTKGKSKIEISRADADRDIISYFMGRCLHGGGVEKAAGGEAECG